MQELSVPATLDLGDESLVPAIIRRRAHEHPNGVCFDRYVDGDWLPITSGSYYHRAINKAHGLVELGVAPGERVLLMSDTRFEYMLVELAIWLAGGVSVPVYEDVSDAELERILAETTPQVAVVETEELADRVERFGGSDLQLFVIDAGDLDEIVSQGAEKVYDEDHPLPELHADMLASITYTGGTVGPPKGCMITHGNIAAVTQGLRHHPVGEVTRRGRRSLMFMPLAHIVPRLVVYSQVAAETAVGFWSSHENVYDGFRTYRPHVVLGVPFVFDLVYQSTRDAAHDRGFLSGRTFEFAHRTATAMSRAWGNDGASASESLPATAQARYRIADRTVYHRLRQAFGGRCELFICGHGPLDEEMVHFFRGLGLPIFEGYGLTEAPAVSLNGPGWHWIGSTGHPLEGYSVRVDDSGEILVKGPGVFAGYWQDPEATEAAFTADGWLRTGDIGKLSNEGYVKVFGRASSRITLADGTAVLPEPVEYAIREDPLVSQVVLVGEGRPYLGALIAVRRRAATRWAREHGMGALDPERLVETPEFRARIQEAVDYGNMLLPASEKIRAFTALPRQFSRSAGEVAPTRLLRRAVVVDNHAAQIERMFAGPALG